MSNDGEGVGFVVICLKISTFVVSKTTRFLIAREQYPL